MLYILNNIKKVLQDNMSRIIIPREACLCEDVLCRCEDHVASLNHYAAEITEACHKLAKDVIPITKPRSESGRIPGWTEFVAPLRAQSIFGISYGVIMVGPIVVVADIMRKTRARYHAGIRQLRELLICLRPSFKIYILRCRIIVMICRIFEMSWMN